MFVAEPVHNLVHEDVLAEAGATFVAKRARDGCRISRPRQIAWFRPVNFTVGPDGALYVMDFYRLAIEHPEWMATETYNSKDLTRGSTAAAFIASCHRPTGPTAAEGRIRLGSASSARPGAGAGEPEPVVAAHRAEAAHRPQRAVDAGADWCAWHEESPSPVGRIHALWTLDGLQQA